MGTAALPEPFKPTHGNAAWENHEPEKTEGGREKRWHGLHRARRTCTARCRGNRGFHAGDKVLGTMASAPAATREQDPDPPLIIWLTGYESSQPGQNLSMNSMVMPRSLPSRNSRTLTAIRWGTPP